MKNWTRISLFSAFISAALHFYLIMHFYPLHFGFSADSAVCNINQTFNCDAVSSSQFADILGIPLAAFGFAANAVLFALVLMGWLNWSENSRRFRVAASQLSIFSVLTSVVLLFISFTSLKQHCIVCLSLHVFAFISLALNLKIEKTAAGDWLPTDNSGLKAGTIALIPLIAFLIHKSYLQSYGADGIQRMVQNAVADWQSDPPRNFIIKPILAKGASSENAKMVIKEFADLLCHHCKMAAPSLSAFTASHQDDVRFEFYLFALDADCNPEVKFSSGLSCSLARILVCAEKQNLGWMVQEKIFEKQEELMAYTQPDDMTNKALELFDKTALDQQQIRNCIKDPEINQLLIEQGKQGKQVNVEGTPTIFVSNKKLPRGQVIPVLQEVHRLIRSQP